MRLNFVKTDTCFLKPILKKFISELWVINLSHWKATKVITSTLYYQFFFFFLATPQGQWDLSFPTRNQTWDPGSESLASLLLRDGNSLEYHWFGLPVPLCFPVKIFYLRLHFLKKFLYKIYQKYTFY